MTEQIIEFIEKPSLGLALLIEGQWGTGKTYYIKGELFNELKEIDKNVFYISLFGIETIQDIYNIIFAQNLIEKTQRLSININPKLVSAAINFGIEKISSYLGINNNKSKKSLPDIFELENAIFFFDDLERVSDKIDLTVLLGGINEYLIQKKGNRVVFIANEDEIKQPEYFSFKEKVIGRTILFQSDLVAVYESINLEYAEDVSYFEFLKSYSKFIQSLFYYFSVQNLRSYQYFIFCLRSIYSSIDLENKSIKEDLIYTTFVLASEEKFNTFKNIKSTADIPQFISRTYGDYSVSPNENEDLNRWNFYVSNKLIQDHNYGLSYFFSKELFSLIHFGYCDFDYLNLELDEIVEKKKLLVESEIMMLSRKLRGHMYLSNPEYAHSLGEVNKILSSEDEIRFDEYLSLTEILLKLSNKSNLRIDSDLLLSLIEKKLEFVSKESALKDYDLAFDRLYDRKVSNIYSLNSKLSKLIDDKITDIRELVYKSKADAILDFERFSQISDYEFRVLLNFVDSNKFVDVILKSLRDRKLTERYILKVESALRIDLVKNAAIDSRMNQQNLQEIYLRLLSIEKNHNDIDGEWIIEYIKAFGRLCK